MIDLIAIAVLGVVVLFPKPDLDAHPEFVGETVELDRIAALEDARFAAPNDLSRVIALADEYLGTSHPDFALATLAHLDHSDPQVELLRATAFADRLEAPEAVEAARRGFEACDHTPSCTIETRVRLETARAAMQTLIDHGLDALQQPEAARRVVAQTLREAHPKIHPAKPKPSAPPKK